MKNTIVLFVIYTLLITVLPVVNSQTVSAQTKNKSSVKNIDKGDFKVGFSPATLKENPNKKLDKELAEALGDLVKSLNETIALPYDVYVNFDTCGEANAYYNPSTKEITMCFEFLLEFERVFKKMSDNPEQVEEMGIGAMTVFLFHELGHCLIDVWDLPATGREEDAVDQLAMVILLDGSRDGENMVLSAALFFDEVSREQDRSSLAFWGVHSLDQQRFFDMACLIYGSNPEKNKDLLGRDFLPVERAKYCPAEYQRVDRAWGQLLLPYLKD